MKLELLLASFICIGLASASLVDVLNSLHQNQNFKLLNRTAQILIVELIAATEANELKNYIDQVGFSKVLNMIDHLPSTEAHQLRVYLIQELQIEENQPSPVTVPTVGKRSRDIATLLKYVQQQAAYQNLPQDKQDFITRMLTAAENDTVTDFIAVEGYAAVLELIDVLPVAEGHTLDKYLLDEMTFIKAYSLLSDPHLSSEMGPAVGKK